MDGDSDEIRRADGTEPIGVGGTGTHDIESQPVETGLRAHGRSVPGETGVSLPGCSRLPGTRHRRRAAGSGDRRTVACVPAGASPRASALPRAWAWPAASGWAWRWPRLARRRRLVRVGALRRPRAWGSACLPGRVGCRVAWRRAAVYLVEGGVTPIDRALQRSVDRVPGRVGDVGPAGQDGQHRDVAADAGFERGRGGDVIAKRRRCLIDDGRIGLERGVRRIHVAGVARCGSLGKAVLQAAELSLGAGVGVARRGQGLREDPGAVQRAARLRGGHGADADREGQAGRQQGRQGSAPGRSARSPGQAAEGGRLGRAVGLGPGQGRLPVRGGHDPCAHPGRRREIRRQACFRVRLEAPRQLVVSWSLGCIRCSSILRVTGRSCVRVLHAELAPEGGDGAELESADRSFLLAHHLGRLAGRQAGEEAQRDGFSLVVGQGRQRDLDLRPDPGGASPRLPDPVRGCRDTITASRSACSWRVRVKSTTAFLASRKSQPPKGMPRDS